MSPADATLERAAISARSRAVEDPTPVGAGAETERPAATGRPAEEDMLIVLFDEDEAGEASLASAPDAPAAAAEAPRTAKPRRPAQAFAQIKKGRDLVEVGLLRFTGQDAIERLRAKRSLLLCTYLGGCALCLVMLVLVLFAAVGRTVRVLPTARATAQVSLADFNQRTITAEAYTVLSFMHTWGPGSIDDAKTKLEAFLDPRLYDKVDGNFKLWKTQTVRDHWHRSVRFVGAAYQGRLPDDSYQIHVGYDILETSGKLAAFAQYRHAQAYYGVLRFVAGSPTTENPRGIFLLDCWETKVEELPPQELQVWKHWVKAEAEE